MKYFKHSELTERYHVSLKTVHNWIDAAKQGKIALKLYVTTSRTYVIDTPENILVLNQLANKGKKFRNTLYHKIVEPKPEFYEIYNRRQAFDIIKSLNTHKEIPKQYNYLGDGAKNWDDLMMHLIDDKAPSHLNSSIELIRENMDTIDRLLVGMTKVNVIDLGVGNAYPLKEFLGHLIDRKILHRYIGIDISPTMLSIAEHNLKEWYGDTFPFEGYARDIAHETFDDLLVNDMLDGEADKTMNLVFLLGGTVSNFRTFSDPFKMAHDSMNSTDLFIFSARPDSETTRQNLPDDFSAASNKLSPIYRHILDLLGVDESLYEAERGFDTQRVMRYVRIRLQSAITIKFNFGDSERQVSLEKGETILLHRVWHLTALEIIAEFEKLGFTLVQSSLTEDRQYFLSISAVETKPSQLE